MNIPRFDLLWRQSLVFNHQMYCFTERNKSDWFPTKSNEWLKNGMKWIAKNPNRRIEKCNKRLKSISVDKMTASLGITNNLLMIGVVFQSKQQSVVLFKSNTKTLLYDFHSSISYKTEFLIAFFFMVSYLYQI